MKIEIATPLFAGAHPAFVESLTATMRRRGEVDWRWLRTSDVSVGRAVLLTKFLAGSADVLFWIDGDTGWTATDFDALIAPLESGAFAASAGAYRGKSTDVRLIMSPLPGDADRVAGYKGPVRAVGDFRYGRCRRAGTGFLAVRRDALESAAKLARSFRYYVEPGCTQHSALFCSGVAEDGRYQTEDFFGCDFLRSAGIEIALSLDARPVHWADVVPFAHDGEKTIHEWCRFIARLPV